MLENLSLSALQSYQRLQGSLCAYTARLLLCVGKGTQGR